MREWFKRRRRQRIRLLLELVNRSYLWFPMMDFEWHYERAQRRLEAGYIRSKKLNW